MPKLKTTLSKPKKTKSLKHEFEYQRLEKLTYFEKKARQRGFQAVAGVDEAGRGPIAGPVVSAVCLLPPKIFLMGLDDSKKLTANKRAHLFETITTSPEVSYGIAFVEPADIDRLNIYQATKLSMLLAVKQIEASLDYLLVDGLQLDHPTLPAEKIIRGDSLSLSIAAASILAKVSRDTKMEQYHQKWPMYGFDQHKGYPTKKHIAALEAYGPCPIHRKSFAPVLRCLL